MLVNVFISYCLILHNVLVSGQNWLSENRQDALLKIFSNTKVLLKISYRSSECEACSLRILTRIFMENVTTRIDTFYPRYFLFIQDDESGKNFCPELETNYYSFGENGTYLLSIKDGNFKIN